MADKKVNDVVATVEQRIEEILAEQRELDLKFHLSLTPEQYKLIAGIKAIKKNINILKAIKTAKDANDKTLFNFTNGDSYG